jgi:hypothetical protein
MPTTIMPEEGFSASSIYFSMILHWKGETYIVKHNIDFIFFDKTWYGSFMV